MILSTVERIFHVWSFSENRNEKIWIEREPNKIWQTNKSDIHIHIQDFCDNKQEKSLQTQNIDVTDGELEKI